MLDERGVRWSHTDPRRIGGLVSTDPGEGARLDSAPDQITLEFAASITYRQLYFVYLQPVRRR